MPTVAQALTRGMDSQVRGLIERRVKFMLGQLAYLKEKQNEDLKNAAKAGWTIRKLEVVCWLNSFFQIVVSPLASSATPSSQLDLGGAVPIHYGELIVFDSNRRTETNRMERAFYAVCSASGIESYMLSAHHANDLVYLISKRISENE